LTIAKRTYVIVVARFADTVAFLAGDQAPSITGAHIVIRSIQAKLREM
jgi:hypothetical protein